jgi:poly(hydroxyalkanoate) depolymerase family esterase
MGRENWRGLAAAAFAAAALATAAMPGVASAEQGSLTAGTYVGADGTLGYELYVPDSYEAGTPVPLVVALHGCTQTASGFADLTRLDELAAAHDFIVVYPKQDASSNQMKCWSFFNNSHMQRGAGEPSLIAGITQWVQQHYDVDPHRTYVGGLSAGGAMASVMGATYPDLYAAIGVGSGCEYAATAACAGYKGIDPEQAGQSAYKAMGSYARPMPAIVFEGDQDTTVPPVNAQQVVRQWQVTADLADDGAENGSVPSASIVTSDGQVPGGRAYTITDYSDGHGGELIQSWLVHGMTHAWSGGNSAESYADPSGPDESAAMYAFFMAHPAP